MAVTVVNGYLCTSCAEAAKARSGQDPHAQSLANPSPNGSSNAAQASNATQTPAVVFGGTLTGQNAVAPAGNAAQTGGASGSPPSAGINILA